MSVGVRSDPLRDEVLRWTERRFQDQVVALAKRLGWLSYHTYDARRSDPGFPDLVLVRGSRTLFVELKASKGRVRAAQVEWGEALAAAGQEYRLWRPADWLSQVVQKDLMERGGRGA